MQGVKIRWTLNCYETVKIAWQDASHEWTRRLNRAGWLAGWLADWLAGWLADWLAGRLAGWLADLGGPDGAKMGPGWI